MSSDFYTVQGEPESLTVIEHSKFICYLKNINDEEEAKFFIGKIKKMHSLANHNCYAFIADEKGLIQKFSDDGEPQGTAGVPMLEVLKNRKYYKTVAVVTRYFGGKKLGTGGLVRAYGGAVDNALNNAKTVHMREAVFLSIVSDYENYQKLVRFFGDNQAVVTDTIFDDKIDIKFVVPKDFYGKFSNNITDFFNGKIIPKENSLGYFAFGV